MKVTVKVPASIANIGPGFDCMGIAIPLYNEITVEEAVLPGSGITINLVDYDEEPIDLNVPTDKNNIVYKAIELLYNFIGQSANDLVITIKTGIPVAKGLGSSASVIVGGLVAANELLGKPADLDVLISIATEVEGHPDNITPALLGGFILSSLEEDGSVVYRKLEWPKEWKLTVFIPDFELDTAISRSVLPEKVSIKDAAYNARRCAMLIEAIDKKDTELLQKALTDKLHQPYRAKLIAGFEEIIKSIKNIDGVYGCVLSGAGPSILVISDSKSVNEFSEKINKIWLDLNVNCQYETMSADEQGTIVV